MTVLLMSFSGSVQFASTVTVRGAFPLVLESCVEHVGGELIAGPTTTVWLADPVPPAESVAVNTT
jgi:hypothetical protein